MFKLTDAKHVDRSENGPNLFHIRVLPPNVEREHFNNHFPTARARIERRRQYGCVRRDEGEYPAKANYRYKEEMDPGPSRVNALRIHPRKMLNAHCVFGDCFQSRPRKRWADLNDTRLA